MRIIFCIILLFSVFSCKTINYNFVESFSDQEKKIFINNLDTSIIKKNDTLKGIYSEKNKSYKFQLDYNIETDYFHLIFYNALDEQIVFDASLKKNEKFYDYFNDSVYTSKIGIILDKMKYILNIFPDNFKLMLTKDDFIVSVDKTNNYQKYNDKNKIIKKENSNDTIRYFYSDDEKKLIRIEFQSNSFNFILIFENI